MTWKKNLVLKFFSTVTINVIIACFYPFFSYGQHAVVIPSNKFAIYYQKHPGYVVLTSGDTVKGVFQYASFEFPTWNLKYFNNQGQLIGRYKSKTIQKVVLTGADKTLTNRDSTFFIVDSKHNWFFRQLTFGQVQLFDTYFNAGERTALAKPPYLVKADHKEIYFNTDKNLIKWFTLNYPDKIGSNGVTSVEQLVRKLNQIQ